LRGDRRSLITVGPPASSPLRGDQTTHTARVSRRHCNRRPTRPDHPRDRRFTPATAVARRPPPTTARAGHLCHRRETPVETAAARPPDHLFNRRETPAFTSESLKIHISLQCAFFEPKKNTSFLDQKQFFSLQCLNSTFPPFFVKKNAKNTHPDTSQHFYLKKKPKKSQKIMNFKNL
jgi:hypothetical protein